jgi:uncharacterized membrane protein YgdD (TMEM256/DUF423 family)
MMKDTFYIKLAAVLGALAVGIGAFGAHGLEPVLETYNRVETFETAVKYHFYHTLAILLVGMLIAFGKGKKLLRASTWSFLIGILIFSGSLYILSVTNITWLGAVTPIGGLAFIAGWILLAVGAGKK